MTDAERARLAASWWRALQPHPNGSGGDRAALAQLRRCATAADAAMEPATLDLARQLGLNWRGVPRRRGDEPDTLDRLLDQFACAPQAQR